MVVSVFGCMDDCECAYDYIAGEACFYVCTWFCVCAHMCLCTLVCVHERMHV